MLFDNLFVFLGPIGTAAAFVVALAGLTGLFSVGRHFKSLDAATRATR